MPTSKPKPQARHRHPKRPERDPIYSNISRNVRVLMAERQMLQADLGDAIGIDQTSVSRSLRDERIWTVPEVIAIANLFAVTAEQLWGDSLVLRNRCFRQESFAFAA